MSIRTYQKDHLKQHAGVVLASPERVEAPHSDDALVFWTQHEVEPREVDLHIFAKGHEGAHQVWTCKKCGSTYSYDWEDFSIHVSRVTMKATETKVAPIGKPAVKPIPLFLGLSGHSFPPQSEMVPVSYEDFEVYMLEE